MSKTDSPIWRIMRLVKKADYEGLDTLHKIVVGSSLSEDEFESDDGESAAERIESALKAMSPNDLEDLVQSLEENNLL